MKLATFDAGSGARLGALTDNGMVDLTATGAPALASMMALIEAGDAGLRLARETATGGASRVPDGYRLLSPLPVPAQLRDVSCFPKHIAQAPVGMQRLKARLSGEPEPDLRPDLDPGAVPAVYRERVIFYFANRFNVVGHEAEIRWPRASRYMDYELEIACVIGRRGKDIPQAEAMDHVFGYTIFNDFSARDLQVLEAQAPLGPSKSKSFDAANVLGPVILTADEVPDPRTFRAITRINGETIVDTDMSAMLHGFDDIVAFLSQDETLHPGEVIGGGTIGDGCGLEHSRYLADGDVVELEVPLIGTLRNRVRRTVSADTGGDMSEGSGGLA